MLRASRAHLDAVGESYFEHLRFALAVGTLAIGAGLACVLHALVPAMCEKTCSRAIGSLQRLFGDRNQMRAVLAENSALFIFVLLIALSCVTAVALAISSGLSAITLILLPQAFALPLIFLSQNPQLEAGEAA